MKLIGILLIVNSLALASYWITSKGSNIAGVTILCLISVFVGIYLLMQERVTELTVKGVGTIKMAAKQAKTDAKIIASLKDRVENQSATIDLVANEASKAKEISEDVAEKNRIAEEKLFKLDKAIDQVKKLAISLSDSTAISLATADNPFQYVHLKYKIKQIENIRGILQELDVSENEIDQALNVFTSRVITGHMRRILNYLNKKLPLEKKLFTKIDEINVEDWDLKRVRQALKENEVEAEGELKETILDLEFYIENHKLRRESKWQG